MSSFIRTVFTLLLAWCAQTAVAQTTDNAAKPKGSLVMIGGNLHYNNEVVWNRIIELAGGKGAKIAVFASAAGNPVKSAAAIADTFNRLGAQAFFVPVAVKLKDVDYRKAAADPALVEQVRNASGIYFSGGEQGRITQALRTEDGKNTPMLDAIWDVYRRGGVIAGSSAGAAIMSTTMFHDAKPVLPTLKLGVTDGKEIAPGLGFIGPDVFIDQHLLIRGRFARMMPVMLKKGYKLGLGVDENTAMVLTNNSDLEVIGYKGIMVVDLSEASTDSKAGLFNIRNAKLSYLDRGDRFNIVTKAFTPSKQKESGKVNPANPYYLEPRFFPDIIGNTAAVDLMQNLIDNKQQEVTGLAFGGPDDEMPDVGFEFRFRKTPESVGYFTSAFGGEDYSVLNISLDVKPIKLNQPLYSYK